jgi:hypothetical protein
MNQFDQPPNQRRPPVQATELPTVESSPGSDEEEPDAAVASLGLPLQGKN